MIGTKEFLHSRTFANVAEISRSSRETSSKVKLLGKSAFFSSKPLQASSPGSLVATYSDEYAARFVFSFRAKASCEIDRSPPGYSCVVMAEGKRVRGMIKLSLTARSAGRNAPKGFSVRTPTTLDSSVTSTVGACSSLPQADSFRYRILPPHLLARFRFVAHCFCKYHWLIAEVDKLHGSSSF